jgi:hypothetical protein
MVISNTFSMAVLSTASPMEIGATIWHRDFASLVASPMSCFCLTCLPCLKSPCQVKLCLLGVSLRSDLLGLRQVRSTYSSQECSRNAAVDPGDTLPTLKRGAPLSYETLLLGSRTELLSNLVAPLSSCAARRPCLRSR